jgi:hypothetical protein
MKKRVVWQVVVAVISGLYTTASLILDALTLFPAWHWQYHALIGFLIFAFIMIWMVYEGRIELDRIRNAKPNVVLTDIEENLPGNVTTREYSSVLNQLVIGQTEHPNFTRIWIANEPMNTFQEVDAIKLYSEISFYDDVGINIFVMGGRWSETPEIANGAQPIEIDQIDLPPNGRQFCMDIGLKYYNEDEFYGYNNETPRRNTKGFRDNDRKLGKGNYYVKVRLRCKGVDKTILFKLINPGAGQDINFKEISTAELPCLFVGGLQDKRKRRIP